MIPRTDDAKVESAYALAREQYAAWGVNVPAALAALATVPVSVHCWQGDDVGGFENSGSALGGGLAVTGQYRGKARTPDELRGDADQAFSLIPGTHRFNLHASYREAPAGTDRDAIRPEHFTNWVAWAKDRGLGLDFNPTFFAHPKAADGWTLAHADAGIRKFWIDHGQACRHIGARIGRELGSACVTNVWVPDGSKDQPADRRGPRERLTESLDTVFAEPFDAKHLIDAVEGKLFGLGSECFVAGSHEFYQGYATTRKKWLCLDAGHFHPTESVADKLSAVLPWLPGVLLHVSRGVRWDSDHVVTLTDDVNAIAQEAVRGQFHNRIRWGLDFFDASINRVAAWVIGTRALQKALLAALLEPATTLQNLERDGDLTARLALIEEMKSFPTGAVWDYYCLTKNVPVGPAWLGELRAYERDVQSRRG